MKNEFTTFEIMKILNMTRGRLREWLDTEMIKPSIQESSGKGINNLFSRWDLYGLQVLHKYKSDFSTLVGIQLFVKWQKLTKSKPLIDKSNIDYLVFFRTWKEMFQGANYADDEMLLVNSKTLDQIKTKLNCDYAIIINMKKIFKFVDERTE